MHFGIKYALPFLRSIFVMKLQITSQGEHPALDPSTPWYEWISYLECCNSLGIKPSLGRFIRYNEYYRSIVSS